MLQVKAPHHQAISCSLPNPSHCILLSSHFLPSLVHKSFSTLYAARHLVFFPGCSSSFILQNRKNNFNALSLSLSSAITQINMCSFGIGDCSVLVHPYWNSFCSSTVLFNLWHAKLDRNWRISIMHVIVPKPNSTIANGEVIDQKCNFDSWSP